MQVELYGESKKAKAAKAGKEAEIDLERDELVVLGRTEIEYLTERGAARSSTLYGDDAKAIAAELKNLRKNFHALRVGAGIDAAMFGRFVSGDRDARVDAAVHVAHAFTVHEQASEPDYFTAVDDLQAEEQGSGAGHLNTAELTSGRLLRLRRGRRAAAGLEPRSLRPQGLAGRGPDARGQDGRASPASDRQGDARAPSRARPRPTTGRRWSWSRRATSSRAPSPTRFSIRCGGHPMTQCRRRRLSIHVEAIDGMYGTTRAALARDAHRWHRVPGAETANLPAARQRPSARRSAGAPEMRCLILRLEGPLMSFGDVAIDEIRPTRRLPTRSMLTGLLANALGYDASRRRRARSPAGTPALRRPARSRGAGARRLPDRRARPRTTRSGRPAACRRSGPAARRLQRAGAALSPLPGGCGGHRGADPGAGRGGARSRALEAALRRPERPLFIGRKGCPPSRPILDRVVAAGSLVAALDQVPPLDPRTREPPTRICDRDRGRAGRARRHDGSIAVADRRDWRLGLHAGQSRRRELRRPLPEARHDPASGPARARQRGPRALRPPRRPARATIPATSGTGPCATPSARSRRSRSVASIRAAQPVRLLGYGPADEDQLRDALGAGGAGPRSGLPARSHPQQGAALAVRSRPAARLRDPSLPDRAHQEQRRHAAAGARRVRASRARHGRRAAPRPRAGVSRLARRSTGCRWLSAGRGAHDVVPSRAAGPPPPRLARGTHGHRGRAGATAAGHGQTRCRPPAGGRVRRRAGSHRPRRLRRASSPAASAGIGRSGSACCCCRPA